MPLDPDHRRQLGQQGRLWGLSLICATVGAVTVWRTDDLMAGIAAFSITLLVCGLPLWAYERSRRHRDGR